MHIPDDIHRVVQWALEEDIGSGDVSAQLTYADRHAEARVISREHASIAGIPWFNEVFRQLDPKVQLSWLVQDGERIAPNQDLCVLSGLARSLLSGERTALNFLQTLSGTASKVYEYIEQVADTGVTLLDTRKTLPCLRSAQKYAVRCGGGKNHRQGLYDAFLIKENHIIACGTISSAVNKARKINPDLPLEVEVETIEQLEEALRAGADIVMLDNFIPQQLKQAVALNQGRAKLEASGNVTTANLREIALTGVDYISLGTLTKDVRALDLSMRFISL
jgi:nicotinate-nucleotide pyrophosphorylase (carboxylating)